MPGTALPHDLRALMAPRSVVLVGASGRVGSIGRIVLENLLSGDYTGQFFPVNPGHRKVLGQKSYRSIDAIGAPVELALIVSPPASVPGVIDEAGGNGVRAAVVLTDPPPGDRASQRQWTREITSRAQKHGMRLIGPGAFGVIRTDIGLNASVTDVPVTRGRLALVAQSGAVCTAMIDFAAPMGIGFSTVVALSNGIDVGIGDILDYLMLDRATDAILLYVESVKDSRRFLSALRTAARTKPVVVLKAGRSQEIHDAGGRVPSADAVFDSAMRRSGTVRVRTYMQLFSAARILSMGRIPRGDRLAIVANGHGPALLAADSAADRGVRLAKFEEATSHALSRLVAGGAMANPIDMQDDAPAERLVAALAIAVADPNVDAALVLYVPRPTMGPTDVARFVADVGRSANKPVLAAWLGAPDRHEAREALEAGGIADFYTPENAVEAFSFLAGYRRYQELLLEAPSAQPEPPDLATAEAVRQHCDAEGRTTLELAEAMRLLQAFGIVSLPTAAVGDIEEAVKTARGFGYPVSLEIEASQARFRAADLGRDRVGDSRVLRHAWPQFEARSRARGPRHLALPILMRKEPRDHVHLAVSVGVSTDAAFGPVIAVGPSRSSGFAPIERALMLPPLNRRLAGVLLENARMLHGDTSPSAESAWEATLRLLLQISSLTTALPWVTDVELDPVYITSAGALAACVSIGVDMRRASLGRYAHLAIHPYPVELESESIARNGTAVHIRPIRPEDATLEQRFVNGLSDRSRYLRFFYQLQEISPAMVARFTQVDYDREIALVACIDDPSAAEGVAFIGVARFVQNPDRTSAEYAIVIDDKWQGQGIGGILMRRLIEVAREKGLARLEGVVLRDNAPMLRFVEGLGFTVRPDPDDSDQMQTTLELAS